MELLRHVAATIRFPGPNDDPVELGAAPTLTIIRDSDGEAIVEDLATTKVDDDPEDVHYTAALTGEQVGDVDLLRATWAEGSSTYTTLHEVVGGVVVSIKAIREKYGQGPSLADSEVAEAREIALRQIERACRFAFRPRYAREVATGSGGSFVLAHIEASELLGAWVDGEAIDLDSLTLGTAGTLSASPAPSSSTIEVAYVHGYESYPEALQPVKDLAAYFLTKAPLDYNERATSYVNDQGNVYSLVTPGRAGARFALPSVNAFVNDNRLPTVA